MRLDPDTRRIVEALSVAAWGRRPAGTARRRRTRAVSAAVGRRRCRRPGAGHRRVGRRGTAGRRGRAVRGGGGVPASAGPDDLLRAADRGPPQAAAHRVRAGGAAAAARRRRRPRLPLRARRRSACGRVPAQGGRAGRRPVRQRHRRPLLPGPGGAAGRGRGPCPAGARTGAAAHGALRAGGRRGAAGAGRVRAAWRPRRRGTRGGPARRDAGEDERPRFRPPDAAGPSGDRGDRAGTGRVPLPRPLPHPLCPGALPGGGRGRRARLVGGVGRAGDTRAGAGGPRLRPAGHQPRTRGAVRPGARGGRPGAGAGRGVRRPDAARLGPVDAAGERAAGGPVARGRRDRDPRAGAGGAVR